MRSASKKFRQQMNGGTFHYQITATFSDGSTVSITEDDIIFGDSQITWTTGSKALPVGNAIAGELTLSLINPHTNGIGFWDDKDFYKAHLNVRCYQIVDNVNEYVWLGTYYVSEPAEYGDAVTVKAYDYMYRIGQIKYKTRSTELPATMGAILVNAVEQCGVTLAGNAQATDIVNYDAVIRTIPNGLTCRDVISYCAVWAGGNAYIEYQSGNARVRVKSNSDIFTLIDNDEYASGSDQTIRYYKELDSGKDDIQITGVQYTRDNTTYTYGLVEDTEENTQTVYAVGIEQELIPNISNLEAVVNRIGPILAGNPDSQEQYVNGLKFRRFTASVYRNPLFQVMDVVKVVDIYNRQFTSILTDVTYKFFGYTEIACNAEDPIRNGSSNSYTSPTTVAINGVKEALSAETYAREQAVQNLQNAINYAMENGSYMTTVTSSTTGGSVMYLHDKPEMSNSQIIVSISSNAFAISTNGGQTYPYGIDINSATLIMERIYSTTVNADRITFSGSLAQVGLNNTSNFSVTANGVLTAKSGSIGGWNITDTLIYSDVVANNTRYRARLNKATATNSIVYAVMNRDETTPSSPGEWQYPFYVRANGQLTATDATITGNITATSGNVGGYTVGATSLYSMSEDVTTQGAYQYGVRLNNPTTITSTTQAIGVRVRTFEGTTYSSWEYPFYVNYDGFMRSTKGVIGGYSIDSEKLSVSGSFDYTWNSLTLAKITSVLTGSQTQEWGIENGADINNNGWVDYFDLGIVENALLHKAGLDPSDSINYKVELNSNQPFRSLYVADNSGTTYFSAGIHGIYTRAIYSYYGLYMTPTTSGGFRIELSSAGGLIFKSNSNTEIATINPTAVSNWTVASTTYRSFKLGATAFLDASGVTMDSSGTTLKDWTNSSTGFMRVIISTSSNKVLTCGTSVYTRFIIVCAGYSVGTKGIYIVTCTNSGTMSVVAVSAGSNISYTTATRTLTMTNSSSSNSVVMEIFVFAGSVTSN